MPKSCQGRKNRKAPRLKQIMKYGFLELFKMVLEKDPGWFGVQHPDQE
jgi:hypothetical protein